MEKAAITSSNLPQDRALSEMDEFVYAISHDLRAPLLNFQGFLHRLERASEALRSHVERGDLPIDQRRLAQQILDEKIKPSLEVLEQNARRMDRLLTALLDLSRTGREPVQMQEVNGAEIARAVIEEFRPAAGAKNARLVLEPIPVLWADPQRLQEIFRRLIDNSLKFLHPQRPGLVTVGGSAGRSEHVCWVQDNGIGIRGQDRDRIFRPFGKVQEIPAPGEGAGLATVRKLIEQQHGRLWVESDHGLGSTFFFALPARPGTPME